MAPRSAPRVERAGFNVEALLRTHAHFDHVGADQGSWDLWQCPAYLHQGDGPHREPGLANCWIRVQIHPKARDAGTPRGDTFRGHGRCTHLDILQALAVSTGTSRRGRWCSLATRLFCGGIGRTDLGRRFEQLEQSIRSALCIGRGRAGDSRPWPSDHHRRRGREAQSFRPAVLAASILRRRGLVGPGIQRGVAGS